MRPPPHCALVTYWTMVVGAELDDGGVIYLSLYTVADAHPSRCGCGAAPEGTTDAHWTRFRFFCLEEITFSAPPSWCHGDRLRPGGTLTEQKCVAEESVP